VVLPCLTENAAFHDTPLYACKHLLMSACGATHKTSRGTTCTRTPLGSQRPLLSQDNSWCSLQDNSLDSRHNKDSRHDEGQLAGHSRLACTHNHTATAGSSNAITVHYIEYGRSIPTIVRCQLAPAPQVLPEDIATSCCWLVSHARAL
jgi:hypothetical protein